MTFEAEPGNSEDRLGGDPSSYPADYPWGTDYVLCVRRPCGLATLWGRALRGRVPGLSPRQQFAFGVVILAHLFESMAKPSSDRTEELSNREGIRRWLLEGLRCATEDDPWGAFERAAEKAETAFALDSVDAESDYHLLRVCLRSLAGLDAQPARSTYMTVWRATTVLHYWSAKAVAFPEPASAEDTELVRATLTGGEVTEGDDGDLATGIAFQIGRLAAIASSDGEIERLTEPWLQGLTR